MSDVCLWRRPAASFLADSEWACRTDMPSDLAQLFKKVITQDRFGDHVQEVTLRHLHAWRHGVLAYGRTTVTDFGRSLHMAKSSLQHSSI